MKILLDTNIVLDHILVREEFAKQAAQIFSEVESGHLDACLCATTVTTIYYLAAKVKNARQAKIITEGLMKLFKIAPVNRAVIENAIASNFSDFEDAVVHESAITHGAQAIITRDRTGFKHANINVYTPNEFVRILSLTVSNGIVS